MTTPIKPHLNGRGRAKAAELPAGIDDARLREMMRWMKLGRAYDQRAISLQRQGRSGTYGPMVGEEAVMTGSAMALDPQRDWIVPQYREALALAIHGWPLWRHLLYLRGHPIGGYVPEDVNMLPIQISVASQILHGVGLAWGLKLQKKDSAVLIYFGDGATSEGAFHEASNFAGDFKVPAVLLCVNNGWAISTPRSHQTAAETIAQKSAGYGFPGVQVDGNDPLAVYETVSKALARARAGEGPTLVEALTYRLGAHTTADEPARYVPPEELAAWKERDPIPHFEKLLEERGLWNDEQAAEVDREVEAIIAEASARADAEARPPADAFFDHVYATPTPRLAEQRELFRELQKE